jgi:hypothetical protein
MGLGGRGVFTPECTGAAGGVRDGGGTRSGRPDGQERSERREKEVFSSSVSGRPLAALHDDT